LHRVFWTNQSGLYVTKRLQALLLRMADVLERATKAEKWFLKVAEKGEFNAHDGVRISTAAIEHAEASGPVVVVLTVTCPSPCTNCRRASIIWV
jgi:hypothetical protein